jgi:hypothetical protein
MAQGHAGEGGGGAADHTAKHVGEAAGAGGGAFTWWLLSCDRGNARHCECLLYLTGKNCAACAVLEKEKKLRQQLQLTKEKANAILAQGKSVDSLMVTELDTLLAWHRAAKIKGAKRVD